MSKPEYVKMTQNDLTKNLKFTISTLKDEALLHERERLSDSELKREDEKSVSYLMKSLHSRMHKDLADTSRAIAGYLTKELEELEELGGEDYGEIAQELVTHLFKAAAKDIETAFDELHDLGDLTELSPQAWTEYLIRGMTCLQTYRLNKWVLRSVFFGHLEEKDLDLHAAIWKRKTCICML